MYQDICLLLDTAGLNSFTEILFEEYKNEISDVCDVYAVVHHKGAIVPTDYVSRVIYLTDAQIFDEVEHHKDTSRGLIPGNLDLKKIRTVREVPDYKKYIWVEYDVFCTGSLRDSLIRLIKATEDSDFAASFITRWKNDGWMWWSSLRVPDSVGKEQSAIAVRAFLPLFVFSKGYIELFEEQMKLGWAGHSEVTMSTIAQLCGARMVDLSTTTPVFAHYPQFGIIEVAKLEDYVPLFVHPVKTRQAREEIKAKLEVIGLRSASSLG
jgi:hypothetical protein